jgi:hypothetical protein
MTAGVRNSLFLIGALWGLLLASVPALVMTSPYRLTGFLVAGLVCAALSGCIGTLAAGRRAAKSARCTGFLAGIGTGAFQGFVGGVVVAFLIWALMALTISGFTLRNPVELSVLMSPRVFMGSFFVALSAFVYTFLGGLLFGPLFGMLVNRAVRAKDAGEKEDLVVR